MERPAQLWLEGQDVVPLVPAAPASGRLHQVRGVLLPGHGRAAGPQSWGEEGECLLEGWFLAGCIGETFVSYSRSLPELASTKALKS